MVSGKGEKINDRWFGFRKQMSIIDILSKITTKILDRFRRKEKTAAIFFDIKKTYDKFNRNKISKQQENMGIQGQIMVFIKKKRLARDDLKWE